MFKTLQQIHTRPKAFEFYTAADLWADEHVSKQMLNYHLNDEVDLSSRNAKFIDKSVEWIIGRFDVSAETKIADFGCGPGLYSSRLAKCGAQITGVDFSENSINYAKEVAAKDGFSINYQLSNYLEYQTDERFDLILLIMCDYCALSPEQRATLLKKFHKFLKPGGYVLLDAYTLNGYDARQEATQCEKNLYDGFWSESPYYGFLNTFKYEEEKVVLDKFTIIEESRARIIYNWLQYFSAEALEQEFTDCGFGIEKLYANVAGEQFDQKASEFAVVAKKQ